MKKVLLATTALVATAGFAAADITITGSANMGLKYLEDRDVSNAAANPVIADGNQKNDTIIHNEIDFNIVASGTSDSGVEFGASVDLDSSEADQGNTTNQKGGGAEDPEVYVKYNGLTVTVGAVSNAGVVLNVKEVGFDELNTNMYVDAVDDSSVDTDVHVSYSISGISMAASIGSDTEDYGVSVSGAFSGVSFGLGVARDDSADTDYTSLGLGYTMGAIDVQALYVQVKAGNVETDNYGLSASYTSGAMTVTAAYSDSDAANTDAAYGVGVSYDLGGGLAVAGGVGSVNDKTVADLGLTMSF